MKPKLFIGSSSESLDVARAVQDVLSQDAEITVWEQGIFDLSKSIFASLLEQLEKSDFGIFILAPDDLTRIRGENVRTPRDNVIFELGLFFGRLGTGHTFFLIPSGIDDLHLPTDLLGITPAKYDTNRQDKNFNAAVGPACNKIRKYLRNYFEQSEELPVLIAKEEADSLSGIWHAAHLSRNEEGGEAFSVHTYNLEFFQSGKITGQMKDKLSLAEYEFMVEGQYFKTTSHLILRLHSKSDWIIGSQFHHMFQPTEKNIGITSSFDRQNRPFSTYIVFAKVKFTKQEFEQAVKRVKTPFIISRIPKDLPDLPDYPS